MLTATPKEEYILSLLSDLELWACKGCLLGPVNLSPCAQRVSLCQDGVREQVIEEEHADSSDQSMHDHRACPPWSNDLPASPTNLVRHLVFTRFQKGAKQNHNALVKDQKSTAVGVECALGNANMGQAGDRESSVGKWQKHAQTRMSRA